MYFLRLIRYRNLILLVLSLLIIRVFYTKQLVSSISLNFDTFYFVFFCISIVLIAASGNIINDIFDIKTDQINKPNKIVVIRFISKKSAFILYFLCTLISIGIGIDLSLKLQDFTILYIFILTIVLLYLYAVKLKGTPLIGNVLIACFTPLPILLLTFIDLPKNKEKHIILFSVFVIYFFGVLLNLIREITKDIQDYKGDYATNLKTLPIIIGKEKSLILSKIIAAFTIGLLLLTSYFLYHSKQFVGIVFLALIILSLLYYIVKTNITNTKKASAILKISMLLGLLTILFI